MSKRKTYLIGGTLAFLFLIYFYIYPIVDAKYNIFAQSPDNHQAYRLKTINQISDNTKIIIAGNDTFLLTQPQNVSNLIDQDQLGKKINDYHISYYSYSNYYNNQSKIYFLSKLNSHNQFDVILSNDQPIDLISSPNGDHVFIKTAIDKNKLPLTIDPQKGTLLYSNDHGDTWQIIENKWSPNKWTVEYNPVFSNQKEAWIIMRPRSITNGKDKIDSVCDSIYYSSDAALNFKQIKPINTDEFIKQLEVLLTEQYPHQQIDHNMIFEKWVGGFGHSVYLHPLSDSTILIWKRLDMGKEQEESTMLQFTLNKQHDNWIAKDLMLLSDSDRKVKGYQDNIYALIKRKSTGYQYFAKLNPHNYQWQELPAIPSIFGLLSQDGEPIIEDFDVTKNGIVVSTRQFRTFHSPLSALELRNPMTIIEYRTFYLLNKNRVWKSLMTKSKNLVGANKQKDIYYQNNLNKLGTDSTTILNSYQLD